MKKILLSLVTVVGVAAMVAGASQAVFSGTDSFVGNQISTARVDIDARSETGDSAYGLLPKPFQVSGLIPGQFTKYARGVVFNSSLSTPVRVYMYLENVVGTACEKTNLQVWTGHALSGADSERSISLFNSNVADLTGSGKKVEITGSGKIFNPTMPVNRSAVIQQRAQLDGSADNSYQNTSCTWDEVFVAETP